jgi:hypothetical protein
MSLPLKLPYAMSRFFSPSTTHIVVPKSRIRLEADAFQGAWTVTIAASDTSSH